MAFVYKNIHVADSLTTGSSGKIITTTKGDLITQDSTGTVRLPVGTDNQILTTNSSKTTGLEWKTLTPADIGLANVSNILNNFNATIDPTANNDNTQGYSVGSRWFNQTTQKEFVAFGVTTGSAIWVDHASVQASLLDPAAIVTLTDTQDVLNKTFVEPKIINNINDNNNNEVLRISPTVSAVNDITIKNATTNNAPQIVASGDDTNIDLNLAAKGTGNVSISSIKYPNTDGTPNQVLATNGNGSLSFVNVPIIGIAAYTTTDGNTIVINPLTLPTLNDSAYLVEAKFIAKETTGTKTASFIIRSTFKNTAGTLALIGTDLVYVPISTVWLAEVTNSSTNIIFRITGSTDENIDWKISTHILSV